MGRVIRHRYDFGAILLCDERFRGDGLQKQLSRWLRDQVQVFPEFGSAGGSLGAFFKVSTTQPAWCCPQRLRTRLKVV